MSTPPGLADSALMFVFLDVSDVDRHRQLLEHVLGLRVIENQFHPPHEHHGLVKYDLGGTIMSLNLFADRKFRRHDSDGLVLTLRTTVDNLHQRLSGYGSWARAVFTDLDGHHFRIVAGQPPDPDLVTDAVEIRLTVPDLAIAVRFYRDVLGLPLLRRNGGRARFATGTIDLLVERGELAPDGRPVRHSAHLPVFHVADVVAAQRALEDRGLVFSSGAGFSDIGGTARFRDPSGHTFCLYQPSIESLTWGSGDKVEQLMSSHPRN